MQSTGKDCALLGVLLLLSAEALCFVGAQPADLEEIAKGPHCSYKRNIETEGAEGSVEEIPCRLQESQSPSYPPSVLEVWAQETARLTVQNITGDPNCSWSFSNESRIQTPQERGRYTMLISRASAGDHGNVALDCVLSGRRFSVTFTVYLLGRPSSPKLEMSHIGPGYAPNILCSSAGYPKPTITWFKTVPKSRNIYEADDLPSNERNMTTNKLSSFRVEEELLCCAENKVGEECSRVYEFDLRMKSSESEVLVMIGQSLLLSCRHTNEQLQWLKDLNMPLVTPFSVEHYDYHRLYLSIPSVTGEHNSTYTCQSKHDNRTKTIRVQVLERAILKILQLNQTNHISASETDSFCFRALVSSYPEARCHWVTPSKMVRCTELSTYWGNRIFKLCNPEPGEHRLHVENGELTITRNISLCVTNTPRVSVFRNEDRIHCSTNSSLPMNFTWRTCSFSANCLIPALWEEVEAHSLEFSDLQEFCQKAISGSLGLEELGHDISIKCCVKNSAGSVCSQEVALPKCVFQVTVLLCVGIPLLSCILLAMAIKLFMLKKKPLYESQLQMLQLANSGSSENVYIYMNFKDFSYDQKWEFPRENLQLGKELGSGAFGRVVEATAYGMSVHGDSLQVAVKMLKEKHQPLEREALISELKMLIYIGSHTNIVNLLGACTGPGPVYLIFQYCCNGDLLGFLKNNREKFYKSLSDVINARRFSYLYRDYCSDLPCRDQESRKLLRGNSVDGEYADGIRDEQVEEMYILTYIDLLNFAYQVAKGMEFLSSKNCIHRDLAARNVLVTHNKLVKIGDFGLARDIKKDSNYVVRGNVWLPVKWMSPESLFQGVYTVQSDVWSYGILLWEIFSLGVTPYPGIKVDQNFYVRIKSGIQMERPYYASESVYKTMCLCWELRPQARPPFSKLVAFMEAELEDIERKLFSTDGENTVSVYQNVSGVFDTRDTAEKQDQLLPQ